MSEDAFVPTCLNCKTIELNVIFDDTLVVAHLEVIKVVFGVGGRINRTELITESTDEVGPIVEPIRSDVGVEE